MIEAPHIIHTSPQHIAVLHLTVPFAGMQRAMGAGFKELMDALAEQGVTPSGPWFTHHLRRPTDSFDFEIGVTVPAPISPLGRVLPSEWPGAEVARTIYQGEYDGLGAAWGEFSAWVKSEGRKGAADFWERYLTSPESGLEPGSYRTELTLPLAG